MNRASFLRKIMRTLKKQIAADCLICADFALSELDLCKACFADIVLNFQGCSICSEPFVAQEFASAKTATICGACVIKKPNYRKMHTFFLYEEPLESILWKFKFEANILAGNLLLQILLKKMPQAPLDNCILISMPKNLKHIYAQKLDSVYWLANQLAKNWNCELLQDKFIVRKPEIPAQRGLSLKQRGANMKNAWVFSTSLLEKLANKNLLLFDDVATTGASINSLAYRLQKFKPKNIEALCILRTSKI